MSETQHYQRYTRLKHFYWLKIFSRNWNFTFIMIFSCFCRYVNNSRRFEGWSKQSTQTRRLSPECHDNRHSGLDCHWAWVTVGKGVIWQKSNISLLKRSYKSKDLYIIEFRGHDILSALHLCPYSLLFKVFCCITWLIIVVSVKRSQARLKLPRTHANTSKVKSTNLILATPCHSACDHHGPSCFVMTGRSAWSDYSLEPG